MRIARARLTPVRLRLRRPLRTAHGSLRAREGVLFELVSEDGASGCGESLPLEGFGLEAPEKTQTALEALARALVGRDAADLPGGLDAIACQAPDAPAARAAADSALHDLAARVSNERVAARLAAPEPPRDRVSTSVLLVGETPAAAAREAAAAITAGFRTLKLKVGSRGLALDVARVSAVRRAVGDGVALRVDANGAFGEAGALHAIELLARFDLEFVEQPVAAQEVSALARIRAAAPVPIAADESVRDAATAERLLALEAADLLIVKPAAVGGLGAAWRIAQAARAAGVDVVVTSFLDSTLGIAAALQLAAALPDSRRAAGLATAPLLADDLAKPFAIKDGAIELPASAGLGIAPDPAALSRCARGPVREIGPA